MEHCKTIPWEFWVILFVRWEHFPGRCMYYPWALPTAPSLWSNLVGMALFASSCLKAAGAELVVLLFGNCYLKLESFLPAICAHGRKCYLQVFSSLHLLGGGNYCNTAKHILERWKKQMTMYEVLLKLYLFGIIPIQRDCFWRISADLRMFCKVVRFPLKLVF